MKANFYLLLILFPVLAVASEEDFESRIRIAEQAGNRAELESLCKEWYASGQYSPGLLNWNYNALMSVEENALYLTQQAPDTYPAMMLQFALGIRPDVRIINIGLLDDEHYRNLLIQTEKLNWVKAGADPSEFLKQLLRPELANRPVYLGSMLDKARLQADRNKLFLTGLALKFSEQTFDNLAVLRFNFENRFRTDYLELPLDPEPAPELVARLNLNYLPAFLLLHQHYLKAGEQEKARQIERLALRIGQDGGKNDEVAAYFSVGNPEQQIVTTLSAKNLERKMKKVAKGLYASETELSNAEYEAFLMDLVKNREFDKINRSQLAKTDWLALLPDSLKQLSQQQILATAIRMAPIFPVQNISHEAATLYCQWITMAYNNATEKKKFKRVVFRLPTNEEWELAARGGRPDAPYPWGGYFVKNSKGCYLGNYSVATTPCDNCTGKNDASNDGGLFPVAVATYFPNDFGLYNMSGNVAEMIADPEVTKGGSWQDTPYYGQISPKKKAEAPSPAIGFRVFMEVIEE